MEIVFTIKEQSTNAICKNIFFHTQDNLEYSNNEENNYTLFISEGI